MTRDECRECGQNLLGERDHRGRFRCFHCLRVAGEALRLFDLRKVAR